MKDGLMPDDDSELQSPDAVVLLQRIAREVTTTRKLVSEALAGMRKAEQEIPEFMRRFGNYFHDIVHIKGEYVTLGIHPPPWLDREMERCHDRMRQALELLHQDDEAFGRIRAEMAKDPLNRYDHTRQLQAPKEVSNGSDKSKVVP